MDAEAHLQESLTHAFRECDQPEQILIRGGHAFDHEWETIEGQAWPLGAVSPHFVDQGAVELFNPVVMVCRDPLGDQYQWIVPLLEEVVKLGRSLLVIATRIRGLTRQIFVVNNLRNALHVIAADARAEPHDCAAAATLDRFRIMTRAQWVASDQNPTTGHLGQLQQVLVDARALFVPTVHEQAIDASLPTCRALVFHVGGESSDEIKHLIPMGRRVAADLLSDGRY